MLVQFGVVHSMYAAKQYGESIEHARKALEIDANYLQVWIAMGLAQLQASLPQEAITTSKRVVELAPWFHMGAGLLAAAYFQAGDRERSQEWARNLAESHGHTLGAALYYAAAGQVDAMFEALDGAYRQRDYFMIQIQYLPFFDRYRSDPRYHALLHKMNLEYTPK
jgi:tetratricopeptide (TPR) repeat protein